MGNGKTLVFMLGGSTRPAGFAGAVPLKPVPDGGGPAPADFRMLDCFDQPLRRSDRVLIETGEHLLLVSATGILEQAGRLQGRFRADLSGGPVKEALSGVSALRVLLPAAQGTAEEGEYAYQGGAAGRGARLRILQLAAPEGAVALAILSPSSGKAARKALASRLKQLGAQPFSAAEVYESLAPGLRPYDKKTRLQLTGGESAFDTAVQIMQRSLETARRNEAGILADHDTEFLHDYRISLRKIRSVLSLFKGVIAEDARQRLLTVFSGLMAPTGALRDLDVYLLERQGYYDLVPPPLHPGLDRMFAAFEKERASAHAALARHLDGAEYKRTVAALAAELEAPGGALRGSKASRPVREFASDLIARRYRKICKRAAKLTDDTPDAEVHKLRIACKKLRYLLEFFAPLYPKKPFKQVLKPLKQLQDNLGLFNDSSVQQAALQDFLRSHPDAGEGGLATAQSIGALTAVLYQRQLVERARVAGNLDRFTSPEIRRQFQAMTDPGKAAQA